MLTNILILFPFILAIGMQLMPSKSARITSLLGSLFLVVLNVVAYFTYTSDAGNTMLSSSMPWISSLNANWNVRLDGLSILMTSLLSLVLPLIFLSIEKDEKYNQNYYSLIWMMIGAMTGVFTTRDGLLFYTFWELALIPIYFIALIWGGENRRKVTFKFFIYTLTGSLFMLAALLYLYQHSANGWDLSSLYEAGKTLGIAEQNFVFWGLFLGFAIKMPIFPFHTWQPDTYTTSPSQGTMLLSGIMLKMGTYGAIRWLLPMVPAAVNANGKYAVLLSVISIVFASCIALVQTDFKRLIAWSSIAHVGLIGAGIFSYNQAGLSGAMVQMLSHGINVVGLFYIAQLLFSRTGTHEMSAMGGFRTPAPKFAALFLIVLLGSIALPLTNGFPGEFLLLNGLFQYNHIMAIFGGLTVILGATYMLRAYQTIMLGEVKQGRSSFAEVTTNEFIVLGLIVASVILFGLFPNILTNLVANDIEYILKMKG